ncbi:Sulfotransferase domain protein [Aquisphaera giovannonii]|uniref:Sulfotransferase domain protein n=1 Tax=Aquisphaera giovannonii TaxID=406548 RepID=A0A5B9W4I0_9BACT|nr:sulfotransferase [Aquisphaera giovannonii]QEH35119.1 Sulfotransferase domain protein [Aquisphaera giovannonii]
MHTETEPRGPHRLPHFLVIGAMKCATTTLHEQLARQPGLSMSRPKEPNFFSDDDRYARGLGWYASCFDGAGPSDLRGESSTHYTKRPNHPNTLGRMVRALPRVKLIYVMRHPIDRLVSHYFHEVTVGRVSGGLEDAVEEHPELIDYGRYAMQVAPYLEAYGPSAVLPVFFDRLAQRPDDELARIGRFLGAPGPMAWDHGLRPQNVGRERLRHDPLRNAIVRLPVLTGLRRRCLPRAWADRLKSHWKVKDTPPTVPPALRERLARAFDPDLERLGAMLGVPLDCASFREKTSGRPLSWARPGGRVRA